MGESLDDLEHRLLESSGKVEDWQKKCKAVAEVSAQQIKSLEDHIEKMMREAKEKKPTEDAELMDAVEHLQKTLKYTETKYRKLKKRYVEQKKQEAHALTVEGALKVSEDRNIELMKTLENEKAEKSRALTGFVDQTMKVSRVLKEWDEGSLVYENMIKDIKKAHADTCAALNMDIEVLVQRTSKMHDEKMEMENKMRDLKDQLEIYEIGQQNVLGELTVKNWEMMSMRQVPTTRRRRNNRNFQQNKTLEDKYMSCYKKCDELKNDRKAIQKEKREALKKLSEQLEENKELKEQIEQLTIQLDTMGVEEIDSEDEEEEKKEEEKEKEDEKEEDSSFETVNESDLDE